MSYEIYKVVHLLGVFMILVAMGGLAVFAAIGEGQDSKWRKLGGLTNGIGLLLALVGGFGLIARLQLGFPGWVVVKLLIWLTFGMATAVANRIPAAASALWWASIGLAGVAALLANYRPF